ncbi:hypothetical protein FIBSPDRAFT_933868 [Athelia psychrophila]|uniref:DUF7918 domain-containing protein n=1 Tax=Athelia psychrophila TaxID=1759441 RepID=A0A166GB49_9AGAM|nr:hypothetical protein FIBSPDRAFT_933868 [Fibularhizoctonia sp. CBS 109695]
MHVMLRPASTSAPSNIGNRPLPFHPNPMPLELPGFSAWIECEGSKLACHAVERSDDGKTATCWIASEVGKTFSIRWSRERCGTTQVMSGGVYIDGVQCGLLQRMESDEPSTRVFYIHGISTSSSTIRPFTFANLQFTGKWVQICHCGAVHTDFNRTDENEYTETGNARHIGEIELKIYHRKKSTIVPATWTADNPLGEPKIHERAKKATSHKVKYVAQTSLLVLFPPDLSRLGDETMCQNSTEQYTVTLGEKLANFTFKYRPIDVLRANGIILDTAAYPGPNFATNLEAAHDPGNPVRKDGSNLALLAVKEEASKEVARVAAGAPQDLHIKIEADAQDTDGTQSATAQDEEDADVAELRALKEKYLKLKRKIEMKALRKRLADLEREENGDPSTSQGPAKKARTGTDATGYIACVQRNERPSTSQVPATKVRRRSSIMDLTGDSD